MKKNPYKDDHTRQGSGSQDVKPTPEALGKLAKCLTEKDNRTLIELLKEYPELIKELDNTYITHFRACGPFHIRVVNGMNLLIQDGKLTFFNSCREVVYDNLMEQHYFYEKELKEKQNKKLSD